MPDTHADTRTDSVVEVERKAGRGTSSDGPRRSDVLLRASRHHLAQRAAAGLARAGVERGERLLVLASGGADSTALLVLLVALAARDGDPNRRIAVLSVDHGLRPESSQDATFAVATARDLGLVAVESVRVAVAADGNRLERAREARLEAALAYARREGASAIALGHHADDHAESLLLALGRGGGIDALRALREARAIASADGHETRLVRPLLGARRQELRQFLVELGMTWVEDPSNGLRTRGAMRSSPELADLLDRIATHLPDLGGEVEALCAWRDAVAADVVEHGATAIGRAEFEALPVPVRGAVLARLVGPDLPRPIARAILARVADGDRSPARFRLSPTRELVIDARRLGVDS